MEKKVTKATIKSFIYKNIDNIFIKVVSSFNGMTDCVESTGVKEFEKVEFTDQNLDYTMGISGVWFVGSSRNYFRKYEDDNFIGYSVMNSCGSFVLVIKK
jgi:hypothetical protein